MNIFKENRMTFFETPEGQEVESTSISGADTSPEVMSNDDLGRRLRFRISRPFIDRELSQGNEDAATYILNRGEQILEEIVAMLDSGITEDEIEDSMNSQIESMIQDYHAQIENITQIIGDRNIEEAQDELVEYMTGQILEANNIDEATLHRSWQEHIPVQLRESITGANLTDVASITLHLIQGWQSNIERSGGTAFFRFERPEGSGMTQEDRIAHAAEINAREL
jgi:hypothetical protein